MLRSTRLSFVRALCKTVHMVTFAHSLTVRSIWKHDSFISTQRSQTFTCSTLRQNGAPTWQSNTTRPSASMLTTGRTFGANLTCSTTILENCVKIGKQAPSLATIIKGVPCKHIAQGLMGGRNRFTTHCCTRPYHASNVSASATSPAATTTRGWETWESSNRRGTSTMSHKWEQGRQQLYTITSWQWTFKR